MCWLLSVKGIANYVSLFKIIIFCTTFIYTCSIRIQSTFLSEFQKKKIKFGLYPTIPAMYVCQYVPWVLVKSFPFMRSLSLCQYFPFQSSHLISTPSNNVWEINLSMYSSYGRNKRKFSSFLTIVFGSLKASESIFIAWTCTIKKMRQNRTKRKQITKCK